MADTSFDINNGANLIAPNAMTQNQYFYGEEFARKIGSSVKCVDGYNRSLYEL